MNLISDVSPKLPMRKSRHATESEGLNISDCLSPKGEFPKCTEDDRACRKGFSPGALLSVTFLGHARKVTTNMKKALTYSTHMKFGVKILTGITTPFFRFIPIEPPAAVVFRHAAIFQLGFQKSAAPLHPRFGAGKRNALCPGDFLLRHSL